MPSVSYHLLTPSRACGILKLQKQIFSVGFGVFTMVKTKSKYIICICLALFIVTFIFLCLNDVDLYRLGMGIPADWPIVELEEYGSIYVHKEWEVTAVDCCIYVYSNEDGERRNIFVQSGRDIKENNYFSNIDSWEEINSVLFGNGSQLYKAKINYKDGSSQEMFYLKLQLDTVGEKIYLYCVDDSISEKTLRKIVKSHYCPSHHKEMVDKGLIPNA